MALCGGGGWLMGTQLGIPVCEIYICCPVHSGVLQLIPAHAASCMLLSMERYLLFYEVLYRALDKGKN